MKGLFLGSTLFSGKASHEISICAKPHFQLTFDFRVIPSQNFIICTPLERALMNDEGAFVYIFLVQKQSTISLIILFFFKMLNFFFDVMTHSCSFLKWWIFFLMSWRIIGKDGSSRPELFCKKGIVRNFAKVTGKHLRRSLFFTEHLRWMLLQRPNSN